MFQSLFFWYQLSVTLYQVIIIFRIDWKNKQEERRQTSPLFLSYAVRNICET